MAAFGAAAAFESKYALGREIGRGSFSVVREATDRATGTTRAAKLIPLAPTDGAAAAATQSAATAFNREELEVLLAVRHDHIVSARDAFLTPTHAVLVTDLVRGGELFAVVSRQPLPEPLAARLLGELLLALRFLHARGIVHRDVKLENIMVENASSPPLTGESGDGALGRLEQSHVRLIDFGFSKRVGDRRMLTSCCGSPNYMAPEMLRASSRLGPQAGAGGSGAEAPGSLAALLPTKHGRYGREVDLWSSGVVLYAMLFSRYPFFDERRSVWHRSILQGRYTVPEAAAAAGSTASAADGEPAAAVAASLSDAARDLLARLLTVDPDQRITAAEALRHPWIAQHAPHVAARAAREEEADRQSVGGADAAAAPVLPSASGVVSPLPAAALLTPPRRKTPPLVGPVAAAAAAGGSRSPPAMDGAAAAASDAQAALAAMSLFTPPHNNHRLTYESP